MQPRENAWKPDREQRDAEELPVERERDGPEVEITEAHRKRQQQADDRSSAIPGLKTKKLDP